MKTAVIAGATGLIGKQLLEALLQSDRYASVVALTRRPMVLKHPQFKNIITDFKQLNNALTNIDPDDVFCCLGTTMAKAGSKEKFYEVDFQFPLNLAKATRGLGAKQYLLVSAVGADAHSKIYYNRVKGEVENAVRGVGFDALHIFRPSLLLGPRAERRVGEDIAKLLYKVFSFAIPPRYKAISSKRIAEAMIAFAARDMQGMFIHESRDLQGKLP